MINELKMFGLGLITMCIFAYIDSRIFVVFEEDLTKNLKEIEYLDDITRPVLLSGMASAFAILISKSIKNYIIFITWCINKNSFLITMTNFFKVARCTTYYD